MTIKEILATYGRRWPYWLGWVVLAFALGVLVGCAPASARADANMEPSPRFRIATTRASDSTFWVKVYNIRCSGGPDSLVMWTRSPMTGNILRHQKPGCPARDSFELSSPAPNGTIRDSVRAYTRRRGLSSDTTAGAWSYTKADSNPPPPVWDSVTTVGSYLNIPAYTRPMGTDEAFAFCPAVRFLNGLVGWSSQPTGKNDPVHDACIGALRARFPLAQRITSPAAQAVADSEVVAFTWESPDGNGVLLSTGPTWAIFAPRPGLLGALTPIPWEPTLPSLGRRVLGVLSWRQI